MKLIKISVVNMALIMVYIMIMATTVNAVNSFCVTGDENEKYHDQTKKTIKKANNELNDYFTNYGQLHIKDTNGRTRAVTIMTLQHDQPQNYIYSGHGYHTGEGIKGTIIGVGESSREYLYASQLQEHIKAGNCLHTPAAPFSVYTFMACWTWKDPEGEITFRDVIMDDLSAWMYIGITNYAHFWDMYNFIEAYTDKITDGKKSYKRAVEESRPWFTWRWGIGIGYSYWDGGYGLDHASHHDKYRYIDRDEDHEEETLNKGSTKTLYYYRNFNGDTNGAYVVFHGYLDSDIYDTAVNANIRMKIYKHVGGQYYLFSNILYEDIYNRDCTLGSTTAYGGSDIISCYIYANTMKNIGSDHIKIEVKFESGSANDIYINRFEIMEIGK